MKLKGPFLTLIYHAHTLLILSLLSGFGSSDFGVVATGPSHEARWVPRALEHRQAGAAAHLRRALNRRSSTSNGQGPSWRRSSDSKADNPAWRRSSDSKADNPSWRRSSEVVPRDTWIEDGEEDLEERQSGNELSVIRERRLKGIISDIVNSSMDRNIASWLTSLDANGKWPDNQVDYTTGCAARRANWPAQEHWRRVLVMAAAWTGTLPGAEQYKGSAEVKAAVSRGMDYWFKRDFKEPDCLAKGGTGNCPCENPNNWLWNTNWFSNVILIPDLVAQTCLLQGASNLSDFQKETCISMTTRGYQYPNQTGANLLDTSRIGMDQALLTDNVDLLAEAYGRAHSELKIVNGVRDDGIRADGAFAQHDGMLYNGNYGKDYANDVLGVEIEAAGTQFAANAEGKAAFGTQFEGNKWMVVQNSVTKVLHWDFSVLGRFISFPVADDQATGSLKMTLADILELGKLWNSQPLLDFANSLSQPTPHANAGNLIGNRNFYTNDYMVHRGRNYVSTLKTWSTRTRHTECTNSQNPLGFHLADGVTYTHVRGDEYEDIAAAWDWNLIPGITTDYGNTALTCTNTKLLGLEAFVGGVSDGKIGIAAMRYTNPVTKALKWQKAWFYLEDDVQHVMVSNLVSTSSAPVYSVLDQKRRRGDVYVDGTVVSGSQSSPSAKALWHADVGYSFAGSMVNVQLATKTGNWSTIGTSTQPPNTVDLFAARVEHQKDSSGMYPPIAYSVFPGLNYQTFVDKSTQVKAYLKNIQNDGTASAVYDDKAEVLMVVFWAAAGGSVTFQPEGCGPITLTASGNSAVVFRLGTGEVTVADPGQTMQSLTVTVSGGPWQKRWRGGNKQKRHGGHGHGGEGEGEGFGPGNNNGNGNGEGSGNSEGSGNGSQGGREQTKTLQFTLPTGGLAGSSVTKTL